MLVISGQFGSDAGWSYLGPDGQWHHVGGWAADSISDVTSALRILGEASRLKTPGVGDSVSKSLFEFVEKELAAHLGDKLTQGGVVIVNTSTR
jgi:hypothetical protein